MSISGTYLGGNPFSGTSTLTLAISGGAGRVVLAVCTETNNSTPVNVSSVTGAGGTWTNRAAVHQTGVSPGVSAEEWYADFAASFSGTVTVTMSGGFDNGAIMAMLFQSSRGLPIAFDNGISGAVLPSTAITTSTTFNANNATANSSYVFAIEGNPHNTGATSSTQTWLTSQGFIHNSGGSLWMWAEFWGGTTTPLNIAGGTSVGWTGGWGGGTPGFIVDSVYEVVVLQTASTTGTASVSLSGVTIGDLLVVMTGSTGGGTLTVSTTAGTTSAWTIGFRAANVAIWFATAQSTSVTVTVADSGGGAQYVGILEAQNVANSVEQTKNTTGTSGAAFAMFPGSITPNHAGELFVCVGEISGGSNLIQRTGGPLVAVGPYIALGNSGTVDGSGYYYVDPTAAAVNPGFNTSAGGSGAVALLCMPQATPPFAHQFIAGPTSNIAVQHAASW